MTTRWNRVLTVFFAALFCINLAHLVLGFASIPRYYERVSTLTVPVPVTTYANFPANEKMQQAAALRGITLSQYATEQILFHVAFVLLFLIVALLIVARARSNWFAWYSATFLLFIAAFALFDETAVANFLPNWVLDAPSIFWPLVLLYFFLFPNGKPVPRRALWVIGPVLLIHFGLQLFGELTLIFPDVLSDRLFEELSGPANVMISVTFLMIFACQVYRYLRVSTREEKQQTKWFLFGFVAFLVLSSISDTLGQPNPYADEVGLLIFAFVPLSVGVAILRYRLFDIDVIIRRTLTYAIVAALLAVVYFGSVLLLQQLFASLTGQRSEVITVLSTLAIAALFIPMRNRVQNVIDRRFNRKKYDAQQVLADFGKTVRDETDLDKLTGRLIEVVNETMQPKTLSLWLKKNEKRAGTQQ